MNELGSLSRPTWRYFEASGIKLAEGQFAEVIYDRAVVDGAAARLAQVISLRWTMARTPQTSTTQPPVWGNLAAFYQHHLIEDVLARRRAGHSSTVDWTFVERVHARTWAQAINFERRTNFLLDAACSKSWSCDHGTRSRAERLRLRSQHEK